MREVVRRFRERRMFQWALAYLAGAWLLVQVFHVLGQQFDLPIGLLRSVTVLLSVGFLGALVVAWYHGEKGRQRVSGPELLMLAGILVIAGAAVAVVRGDVGVFASDPETDPPREAPGSGSVAEALERSLAVLPFANLSDDRENEHFSDGITEELLTDLARMTDLRVISRTSVMRYKGTDLSIREIGRELGVAHVIVGSVRRVADRVRINAQLLDARTDHHLWVESYDRELDDIFAIQREISTRIAAALRATLPGAEVAVASAPAPPTDNVEAYQLYLEGRHLFHARTGPDGIENLLRSLEVYREALELEPGFARAWAGLGASYVVLANHGLSPLEPAEAMGMAELALDRAIELDPTVGDAHAARGLLEINRTRWVQAEESLSLALEEEPHHANAHLWYGILLVTTGRSERAEEILLRAVDLDPVNAITLHWLSDAARNAGRLDEGRAYAQRSVDLGLPASGIGAFLYHIHRGEWDEAVGYLEANMEMRGIDPGFVPLLVEAVRSPDLIADATAAMNAVARESPEFEPQGYLFDLDAPDLIFDGVEAYVEAGRAMFGLWRMWEPQLTHLRNHPRFHQIARRIGLLDYWEERGWPDLCRPRDDGFVCR
jgi:TolB-like protein/tetratricopeptide (TPR) repeat protein